MVKYPVGNRVRATRPDDAVSGALYDGTVIRTWTRQLADGTVVDMLTVLFPDGQRTDLVADGVEPSISR
jgi:hypothetical protein